MLTKFDGNPLKWQEFWDFYEATIHCKAIPAVEKMKYLKQSLIGDAAAVAQNYRLTNDMYQALVDKLKQRFGNADLVIKSHVDQLWAVPPAKKDTRSLQNTFDECDRHISTLTALGLSEAEFGKIVAPMILAKLPWSVRKEVNKSNKASTWTMTTLRKALTEEIEARQMADGGVNSGYEEQEYTHRQKGHVGSKPNDWRESYGPNQNPKVFRSGAALANPVKMSSAKPICVFCDGEHFSDTCRKIPSIQDRKNFVMEHRLCFRCLKGGHNARYCKSTRTCYFCKAAGHHSAFCFSASRKNGACLMNEAENDKWWRNGETRNEDSSQNTDLVANTTALMSGKGVVYMQMASVMLQTAEGRSVSARILFDSGSTCSFITSKLQKQLQLRVTGHFSLANARFEETERRVKSYPVVTLELPVSNSTETISLSLFVTNQISCKVAKHPLDPKTHPRIRNLKLADTISAKTEMHEVDILIGSDHYFDIIQDSAIRLSDGLVMVESRLGYIPSGRAKSSQSISATDCLLASCFLNARANGESMLHLGQMERFWKLEDIGIRDDAITPDDDLAVELFEKTVEEVDGRITVRWPWKTEHPPLAENRELAYGRFRHLIKRIQPKKDVIEAYDAVIKDQHEKAIIEEVSNETKHDGLVHYLPHHEVIRQDRASTKLRVVYDGSAKRTKKDVSLNECLLRGPNLLGELCGLLLRFRMNPIAFTADIEKAYLQVGLHKVDRDVTRFFWLRDISRQPDEKNVIVYRFTKVLFGIIASAFLLDAAIRFKMKSVGTPNSVKITEDSYVDNVISGTACANEAVEFYQEAVKLFEDVSMNLRAWRTNSKELEQIIPPDKQAKKSDTKVLGLIWDNASDELGFKNPKMSEATVVTKRNFLQVGSRLFDPCVFLSPVSIRVKVQIQSLWEQKLGWEDRIPEPIKACWGDICNEIDSASQIKLPRFLDMAESQFELHAFCDASAKVFAAVVYIRSLGPQHSTKLVMCKARLSPIRAPTIPRLELMGVVIGVRLLRFVNSQLREKASRCFVWTDSKCLLHWLKSVKVLSVFVENRIREIKDSGFTCRYVPTETNPADLPTRGMNACDLENSKLWWTGPEYLQKDESMWPPDTIPDPKLDEREIDVEVRIAIDEVSEPLTPFEFDLERFSSLEILVGATAWAKRFVDVLQVRKKKTTVAKGQRLSLVERHEALILWIKHLQHSIKVDDVKWRNLRKQLDLFEDESGIWRCGGRMRHAEMTDDARFPTLSPKNHRFTNLVIQHAHEQSMHLGPNHTLAQIRTKFWIPQALPGRRVLKCCSWCKIWDGMEFKLPRTAPLPSFRATMAPPFRNVGVDHLGPIYVSEPNDKAWICLFTCAVSRAVHLEVVDSLSGDQFLLCFRRLVSQYGCPDKVVSDNAKCFKLAKKVLEARNRADFAVQWEFIPDYSPWFGGFYERMVGSVKRALRKALGRELVPMPLLQTIVCEVATVVNSRPLTFSNSVRDQILTPAHLLGKEAAISKLLDISKPKVSQLTSEDLVRMYVQRSKILQGFWRIWQRDYLSALRLSHRQLNQKRGVENRLPQVGDVVLLKEGKTRVTWPMAIIEELRRSKDGEVRSVKVKMSNGSTRVRPINLLIPLEVSKNSTKEHGQMSIRQDPTDGLRNRAVTERDKAPKARRALAGLRNRSSAKKAESEVSDDSDISEEY